MDKFYALAALCVLVIEVARRMGILKEKAEIVSVLSLVEFFVIGAIFGSAITSWLF